MLPGLPAACGESSCGCAELLALSEEEPPLKVALPFSADTGVCALTIALQASSTMPKLRSHRWCAFERLPILVVNVARASKTGTPPVQSQIRQKKPFRCQ